MSRLCASMHCWSTWKYACAALLSWNFDDHLQAPRKRHLENQGVFFFPQCYYVKPLLYYTNARVHSQSYTSVSYKALQPGLSSIIMKRNEIDVSSHPSSEDLKQKTNKGEVKWRFKLRVFKSHVWKRKTKWKATAVCVLQSIGKKERCLHQKKDQSSIPKAYKVFQKLMPLLRATVHCKRFYTGYSGLVFWKGTYFICIKIILRTQ